MAILLWILILGLAMWAPSPRGWGDFGRHFSEVYDDISFVLQPLVHFVLMAALAYVLASLFLNHAPGWIFVYSVGLSVLVAVAFEITQSFLPATFSRQCDGADLVPGFSGACIGSLFWLVSCSLKNRK